MNIKKLRKSSVAFEVVRWIFSVIVSTIIVAIVKDFISKGVLQSNLITLLFIFISLSLIVFMISILFRYVLEIRQNTGIKVRYFEGHDADERASLFAEARKVIENAEQSIYVVNSPQIEKPYDVDEMTNESSKEKKKRRKALQERDKYYESLLSSVMKKRNVKYVRILQLREGQKVLDIAQDKGYLKHFRRIFEVKDSIREHERIVFKKVPAKRISTFVLVDETFLIWQINELLPSGEVEMQGTFIFEDLLKQMTQQFMKFIETVLADEKADSIRRSEL